MNEQVRSIFGLLIQPRTILLIAAIFNYIFFFSMSGIVDEFFTDRIPICELCGWYWDWSLINPPSLILYSAIFLFLFGVVGKLAASVISGYLIVEGLYWMSRGDSIIGEITEKIHILSTNDHLHFYDLLELQYLFGLAVFIVAVLYLVVEFIRRRKES